MFFFYLKRQRKKSHLHTEEKKNNKKFFFFPLNLFKLILRSHYVQKPKCRVRMEWEEKKGQEEKQGDNYLSAVGKATGILGDTRTRNKCLLLNWGFCPHFCVLVASVGVLPVAPLDRPGRRGFQGGPGSVPVVLACGEKEEKVRGGRDGGRGLGTRSRKIGWGRWGEMPKFRLWSSERATPQGLMILPWTAPPKKFVVPQKRAHEPPKQLH